MLSPSLPLANAVDAIAYFWQRAAGGQRPSANPDLVERLNGLEELSSHPLYRQTARLAEVMTRGEAMSAGLQIAAGFSPADRSGAGERLSSFVNSLRCFESAWGPRLDALLAQERLNARERLEALTSGLRPIADLECLLREPIHCEISIVPSLLLPPPQDGRHGGSHDADGRSQAWLTFGLPLSSPPEHYGIDREFLRFGAWSHGIRNWLTGAWRELSVYPEQLADACRLLGALDPCSERSPERLLKSHLDLALRNQLGKAIGTTDEQLRLVAEARGLRWFDWFADWVDSALRAARPIREQLRELPRALLESRQALEAASGIEFPDAINLVLISRARGHPSLVVPDTWSDSACAQVLASWSPLRLELSRYTDWYRAACAARSTLGQCAPAIAFGAPEENPLVAAILEQHGFRLSDLNELTQPLLVVLDRPPSAGEPWFLVVAARSSEAAAILPLEILLRITAPWVCFDGLRLVCYGARVREPAEARAAQS
jgi:hypothetical protein